MMHRILFVASEVQPLMKTGGLADAVAGLATALHRRGHDVRILMPGYADTLARTRECQAVPGYRPPEGLEHTRLLASRLPGSALPVWLLDAPGFSNRPGDPYNDRQGRARPDNHARFGALCHTAAAIGAGTAVPDWRADIVHCHDWHTGLVPVYAMLQRLPASIVFTIHNLGYDGRYPERVLEPLRLPAWLWHPEALEYYGSLSFIKGGLNFADRLTTVSPTYAREILTPDHGEGLEGILGERANRLCGILNGLDRETWDPQSDPHLAYHYSRSAPGNKRHLRTALRKEFSLGNHRDIPLVAVVGRLAHQKGIDLLLRALPDLMKMPVRLLILGSGEPEFERQLTSAARRWAGRMQVHIGYEEALAHRLLAGSDMLLMPSRFEPCGLVQLQALRYGTIPVVRHTGGLADTVVDATQESLRSGSATGITFPGTSAESLLEAMQRALELFGHKTLWHALVRNAMAQDFSWDSSARAYETLYQETLLERFNGSQSFPLPVRRAVNA